MSLCLIADRVADDELIRNGFYGIAKLIEDRITLAEKNRVEILHLTHGNAHPDRVACVMGTLEA